ncbi:MAG TPA: hypothetical protein VLJ21_04200 [Candidatus Binatia bacterium]|nr:hypothetical protein [Candidatus Binatia bacterium]
MKEALTIGLLLLLAGCTVVSPGTAGASPDINVNVRTNVTAGNTSVNVNNANTVEVNTPSERDIRIKIAAASVCTRDSDCVDVGAVCPFGCNIVVNKADADRIKALVYAYPSGCTYSCARVDRLQCISGTCRAVVGETPSDDNATQ